MQQRLEHFTVAVAAPLRHQLGQEGRGHQPVALLAALQRLLRRKRVDNRFSLARARQSIVRWTKAAQEAAHHLSKVDKQVG